MPHRTASLSLVVFLHEIKLLVYAGLDETRDELHDGGGGRNKEEDGGHSWCALECALILLSKLAPQLTIISVHGHFMANKVQKVVHGVRLETCWTWAALAEKQRCCVSSSLHELAIRCASVLPCSTLPYLLPA